MTCWIMVVHRVCKCGECSARHTEIFEIFFTEKHAHTRYRQLSNNPDFEGCELEIWETTINDRIV